MGENPPEWACRVFCERANLNYDAILTDCNESAVALRSAIKAGGLLIAAHEDEPVDPVSDNLAMALCAAAANCIFSVDDALLQSNGADNREFIANVRHELSARGLKIVEAHP